MTDVELLLSMYKEQVSRSEHYENLRSSASNIVLVLAGALTALAGMDGRITRADALFGALVLIVSVYGLAASRLHGVRAARHGRRAATYRDEIDMRVPTAMINAIRDRTPNERTYLNAVWTSVHGILALAGAALVLLALLS